MFKSCPLSEWGKWIFISFCWSVIDCRMPQKGNLTLNELAFFSSGNSWRDRQLRAIFQWKGRLNPSLFFEQKSGLFITTFTIGVQEHKGVRHSRWSVNFWSVHLDGCTYDHMLSSQVYLSFSPTSLGNWHRLYWTASIQPYTWHIAA